MIEERVGNLLEQQDLTHLIHQCNPFCNFGKGLAAEIKVKYPEVYQADLASGPGIWKLGSWTYGKTLDGKIVYNLYSQRGLSATDRVTSYDAMVLGLISIRQSLEGYNSLALVGRPTRVGVPYKLGCGLANGSWKIVRAILEEVFDGSEFPVVIVRLPVS